MVWYLTLVSLFTMLLATSLVIFLLLKKEFREAIKYIFIGVLVAIVDFIIEYLGTSTGAWIYHQSVYHIIGKVPIELVLLFFSAGVIARFLYINMSKIKMPVKSNGILYILMLLTVVMYVRQFYQGVQTSLFPFAVVVGIWGITNISQKNREAAIIIALLAVIIDHFLEIFIIGEGGYWYRYGFNISIPVIYGLLTLGVLAVMEKLHKLDDFLDSVIVADILKLFGVYRDKYQKKFNVAKTKVKNKIKR